MFTLFLVAIDVATLVMGLINSGEQSNSRKDESKDDDHSGPDYPCA